MKPSKVFWRFASGGQHNNFKGAVKSTLGIGKSTAVSRMTPENHARLVAGKKPNLKTTAQAPAKKAAQTRGAAAKKAASTGAKRSAAQRTKRTADGKYNGSTPALSPLEQMEYERRRRGVLADDAQMRRLFGGK